jgi:hypothetical protein
MKVGIEALKGRLISYPVEDLSFRGQFLLGAGGKKLLVFLHRSGNHK